MTIRLLMSIVIAFASMGLVACSTEQPVDTKAVLSQAKTFVGSDTCKMCHLEHYD